MNKITNLTGLHHFVSGHSLDGPWPKPMQEVGFAMGCFWGAERLFWQIPGVYITRAGYQGGQIDHPSYAQICHAETGHAEAIHVVFDPTKISFAKLLQVFWENHDPTQGNRQGNDIGTQYRSMIFPANTAQKTEALTSLVEAQNLLHEKGFGQITTQIVMDAKFWVAEEDHQQYLAKNPGGYCNIRGTGIHCTAKME